MEDENHAREKTPDSQTKTVDDKDENKEIGELLFAKMCLVVLRLILKFHLKSTGRPGIGRELECRNVPTMFSN